MMVEKEWTGEEAAEAQRQAREAGLSPSDPTGPLFQWAALHKLDEERKAYEAGDRMALFAAIRVCANHDLIMPEWVSRGFIHGYDKVLNLHVNSWDEAFGRPFPKGLNLSNARRNRELRFAVSIRIENLLVSSNPPPPIDDGLFEEVGAEFNIGKTLAKKLYYEAERIMDQF